jgi:hypothetical protein
MCSLNTRFVKGPTRGKSRTSPSKDAGGRETLKNGPFKADDVFAGAAKLNMARTALIEQKMKTRKMRRLKKPDSAGGFVFMMIVC